MTGKRPPGDSSLGFLEGLELVSERAEDVASSVPGPLPLCLAKLSSRPRLSSLSRESSAAGDCPYFPSTSEQHWVSFASMYVDQVPVFKEHQLDSCLE